MFSPAAKGAALLKKVNEKLGKQSRPINDAEGKNNKNTSNQKKTRSFKRTYIRSKNLIAKINDADAIMEDKKQIFNLQGEDTRIILSYLGITKRRKLPKKDRNFAVVNILFPDRKIEIDLKRLVIDQGILNWDSVCEILFCIGYRRECGARLNAHELKRIFERK